MTQAGQPERSAPAATPSADVLIADLAALLGGLDRDDLAGRATAAAARLRRSAAVVCVVGEFKQGKSSLVNALLGQAVCPVDDDLATSAITLVHYGEHPGAVVRRVAEEGGVLAAPILPEQLPEWVSESGNPGNGKRVERVEVAVPSSFLQQGLIVVDTPGAGGMAAGNAAAVLGFLPFADGMIFVSDSSAELSAPEVEFLRQAIERCPVVLFAQTKTDLFRDWRRIVELNRGHLAREGVDVPIVPVSSVLRAEALARKDRALNVASGLPALVARIGDDVVRPARTGATARSVAEARAIITQVRAGLAAEQAVIDDPAAAAATVAALERSRSRLEHLRGPAAKWNVVIGDRLTDLSNAVTFGFRSAIREIQRRTDEQIESLTKGDEWDRLARSIQMDVSDRVGATFAALEEGRANMRREVLELIAEDGADGDHPFRLTGVPVSELWPGKAIDPAVSTGKKALTTGLTGLRGAQGGIMMLGTMGALLPTAAGVLFASNPVLLGVGAVFGSLGLVEDRKRKLTVRRQAARSQARQFLDDVQFAVNNQIAAAVRDIQRDLRDEFGDRLAELTRTYTDAAARAQQELQRSEAERRSRSEQLAGLVRRLATLDAALEAALAAQRGGTS